MGFGDGAGGSGMGGMVPVSFGDGVVGRVLIPSPLITSLGLSDCPNIRLSLSRRLDSPSPPLKYHTSSKRRRSYGPSLRCS